MAAKRSCVSLLYNRVIEVALSVAFKGALAARVGGLKFGLWRRFDRILLVGPPADTLIHKHKVPNKLNVAIGHFVVTTDTNDNSAALPASMLHSSPGEAPLLFLIPSAMVAL